MATMKKISSSLTSAKVVGWYHFQKKNPGDAFNYTALHDTARKGHFDMDKTFSTVIKVTNPRVSYYLEAKIQQTKIGVTKI